MDPGPIRACAGCRRRRPQDDLLRVVRSPEGTVSVDEVGPGSQTGPRGRVIRAPGRGAYLCRDERCVQRARERGALAKALRVEGALPEALWEELRTRSS